MLSLLAVLILFSYLQAKYKPYDQRLFNYLENLSLVCNYFTFTACLFYANTTNIVAKLLLIIVLITVNAFFLIALGKKSYYIQKSEALKLVE